MVLKTLELHSLSSPPLPEVQFAARILPEDGSQRRMQPLPIVILLDEFFDVHTHVPKVFSGEPPSWHSFFGHSFRSDSPGHAE